MDKKLLLFLLLSTALNTTAQNDNKAFYGVISDDLGVLPNAHIINETTKNATYSNDNGEFRIFVKIGDSLKITSVGYKTVFVKTSEKHFGMTSNHFKMIKEIVELDEVEVKKHNLTGSLALDFKQTPKDKKAVALANNMDFSKIDMTAETKDDYIDKYVRPEMIETDPTKMVGVFGVSTTQNISGGESSKKLWALRKELDFKESIPAKLLSELGKDFFFKDLKIPVDKYYHFLEYCNPLGIEKLYQERKLMEVIKILRKEHVEYLKTIK